MKVLAKATVAIILQYINVPNQHIAHLKLRQRYMSTIYIYFKQEENTKTKIEKRN